MASAPLLRIERPRLLSQSQSRMEIQTDLTLHDWQAFVRFVKSAARQKNKGRRWLIAILCAAGLGAAPAFLLENLPSGMDVKSFAVGALVMPLWFIIIARFRVFRLIAA